MVTRWLAFTVWAAVAAATVFWGLKLFVRPLQAPAHTTLAAPVNVAAADLSRVLGVDAPPPEDDEAEPVVDDRFQLIGVVTPKDGRAAAEGLALIAVDGNPPRAYRVGARVDGDQVLQAVKPGGALLGPAGGAAQVTLELAPPAPAATGTLPAAGAPPPRAAVARPLMPGMAPGAVPARLLPPGTRIGRPQPAPTAEIEQAESDQDNGAAAPAR